MLSKCLCSLVECYQQRIRYMNALNVDRNSTQSTTHILWNLFVFSLLLTPFQKSHKCFTILKLNYQRKLVQCVYRLIVTTARYIYIYIRIVLYIWLKLRPNWMLKVLASTVQTVSFDRDTNGWMTRINLLNNDDVIDECIDRFDSLSISLFYKNCTENSGYEWY